MWISKSLKIYRSLFLLVRVRSGGFRLTLPLALFLIDETFEIIADMLWLAEKFIPQRFYNQYLFWGPEWKNFKSKETFSGDFLPRQILELCRELINELRRHGRYSLVDVEVGKGCNKQRVSVEFI